MSTILQGKKPMKHCPKCESVILMDDLEHVEDKIIQHCFCSNCDFRLSELFKFVDWKEETYTTKLSNFNNEGKGCHHVFVIKNNEFVCDKCDKSATTIRGYK